MCVCSTLVYHSVVWGWYVHMNSGPHQELINSWNIFLQYKFKISISSLKPHFDGNFELLGFSFLFLFLFSSFRQIGTCLPLPDTVTKLGNLCSKQEIPSFPREKEKRSQKKFREKFRFLIFLVLVLLLCVTHSPHITLLCWLSFCESQRQLLVQLRLY